MVSWGAHSPWVIGSSKWLAPAIGAGDRRRRATHLAQGPAASGAVGIPSTRSVSQASTARREAFRRPGAGPLPQWWPFVCFVGGRPFARSPNSALLPFFGEGSTEKGVSYSNLFTGGPGLSVRLFWGAQTLCSFFGGGKCVAVLKPARQGWLCFPVFSPGQGC